MMGGRIMTDKPTIVVQDLYRDQPRKPAEVKPRFTACWKDAPMVAAAGPTARAAIGSLILSSGIVDIETETE